MSNVETNQTTKVVDQPIEDDKSRPGGIEQPRTDDENKQEENIDEALEETFPASDPIAPSIIEGR